MTIILRTACWSPTMAQRFSCFHRWNSLICSVSFANFFVSANNKRMNTVNIFGFRWRIWLLDVFFLPGSAVATSFIAPSTISTELLRMKFPTEWRQSHSKMAHSRTWRIFAALLLMILLCKSLWKNQNHNNKTVWGGSTCYVYSSLMHGWW